MTSQFKSLIMFVVLMNVCSIQNVRVFSCPCGSGQPSSSSCCSWGSAAPKITENDIYQYHINPGSYLGLMIRPPVNHIFPRSVKEIKVQKVENLGNGSFNVYYTVRGTPQTATIAPKQTSTQAPK